MKNLLPKAAFLALAGAGLLVQSARAGYANGDLLLDIQSPVSGNDFVFDLTDSATQYQNATSSITQVISLSTLNSALGSSATDTSWETSANWAVVGESAISLTAKIYASKTEATTGTPNTQGYKSPGPASAKGAAGAIGSIGGVTAGAGTYGVTSDVSTQSGWSKLYTGALSQEVTTTAFNSGLNIADYTVTSPTLNAYGAVYSYFTFTTVGNNVDFTYNVPQVGAPEPTTYGLLAGAGVLALCLGQQLRRKVQA